MSLARVAAITALGWLMACVATATAVTLAPRPQPTLDPRATERFAALALACLHREYPNHLSLAIDGDAELKPPRELHPAFYGCYDWHSAVHGHWLLVRLLRTEPNARYAADARAALDQSLSPTAIAGELSYFKRAGRASFERPYGLAWLLKLAAELRSWDDPQARRWAQALEPLELEAAARLGDWIPRLHYPIRVGEHDQTAFAFALAWDWTLVAHDEVLRSRLAAAADRFYARDRRCPLAYEPSGEDFLSPCLAEADFMRRVLHGQDYARWLGAFLPQVARSATGRWLSPAVVTDRADPKLAHVDGLNLSRAWMLEGIASGLPAGDPRRAALNAAAADHAAAALPSVGGEHYEGGHWLGTFAVYLVTAADRPAAGG